MDIKYKKITFDLSYERDRQAYEYLENLTKRSRNDFLLNAILAYSKQSQTLSIEQKIEKNTFNDVLRRLKEIEDKLESMNTLEQNEKKEHTVHKEEQLPGQFEIKNTNMDIGEKEEQEKQSVMEEEEREEDNLLSSKTLSFLQSL